MLLRVLNCFHYCLFIDYYFVDRLLRERVIIVEVHDIRDQLTDDVGGELWLLVDDYLQGTILEEPLMV